MARPVHADADATRRRILGAATALFAERGPAGGSIRAIAKDAGVSLSMVHHYFGNKDGLYDACVDAMYDELAELGTELAASLGKGGGLSELVERAVRVGFRFARGHQPVMRMLQRTVVEAGPLDPDRRERTQRPFLEQVSEYVGAVAGRPADEMRLPIQSVVMLTARYAISTDEELAFLVGLEGARPEDVARAVEDHLVDAARVLLPLPTGVPS